MFAASTQARPIRSALTSCRVEDGKANKLSRVWIKPRHVWALEAIAMNTGQGEIFKFSLATMLSCNDVIYLERCRMKC